MVTKPSKTKRLRRQQINRYKKLIRKFITPSDYRLSDEDFLDEVKYRYEHFQKMASKVSY